MEDNATASKKIDNVLKSFKDGFSSNDSGIPYDPSLIDDLKIDHEKLEAALKSIQEAISSKNFQKIEYVLHKEFKPVLVKHLISESVKLYTFLSINIPSGSSDFNFLSKVRRKMYEIGHVVFKFVTNYSDARIIENQWQDFCVSFEKVNCILGTRIEFEENKLYQLYESYGNKLKD